MGLRLLATVGGLLVLIAPGRATQPDGRVAADAAGVFRVDTALDFQAALDQVQPGQTILLEAGRLFEGPFYLPQKQGDEWITIRTSTPDSRFVPPGRRVAPADAARMPRLTAARDSVIQAEAGAHHYRFVGVEITPEPGVALTNLVDLGTDSSSIEAVPHHFVFERSFIHGDARAGSRRGIALNSAHTTIVDSYFSDFKEVGADSQAICGWNGPGPYSIVNNYLEGAGENIMFGGDQPTIPNLVPSDIEIKRNHLFKPREWREVGGPEQRPDWSIKNLLELKNARRVLIEGNVLENSWVDSQVGFAVLFTPRGEVRSSWQVVEDVTFRHNTVKHAGNGMALLGWDDINTSRQLRRVRITNNLFLDIGGEWGKGWLFQVNHGTADVMIDHNTALQTGLVLIGGDTLPHTGFVFENNIAPHNDYGIIGSGRGPGMDSIAHYFPGAVIRRNVIAGGDAGIYPPDNFFPRRLEDVGFVDLPRRNLRLSESSQFRGRGSDGADVGVDTVGLARALGGNRAMPRSRELRGAEVWFWGAGALLGYTYVGYAGLVWLTARLRPRPVQARPYEPRVSLVVVAYNEELQMAERIANLLSLDYPERRREVIVVSDGSTDATAVIARASSPDVRVIERKQRRGKAAVFDDVLPTISSEIIMLADARQQWHRGSVRAMVAHFADPSVGAVSGELVLATNLAADAGSQGTEMYWNFEKRLRWWESQVDSTVGVTGAITALRRRLFEPIPADIVLDDVAIPLRIARQGYRVTFEPRARAYDRLSTSGRHEFARKARTLAGNFQLLAAEPWLLLPWRNPLWLQTISHKVLRLTMPALLLVALVSNVMLLESPFYQLTMLAQGLFYGTAALAGASPRLRQKVRPIVIPYAICFLAWATVVGFARFVRGQQQATWEKTPVAAT
jgi:GT2 family glycosyltransferase